MQTEIEALRAKTLLHSEYMINVGTKHVFLLSPLTTRVLEKVIQFTNEALKADKSVTHILMGETYRSEDRQRVYRSEHPFQAVCAILASTEGIMDNCFNQAANWEVAHKYRLYATVTAATYPLFQLFIYPSQLFKSKHLSRTFHNLYSLIASKDQVKRTPLEQYYYLWCSSKRSQEEIIFDYGVVWDYHTFLHGLSPSLAEGRIAVRLAEVGRCFVLQKAPQETSHKIYVCAPTSLKDYLQWIQRHEDSLYELMTEQSYPDCNAPHEGKDVLVIQDIPDADNLISLRFLLTRFVQRGSCAQIHIVGRPANLAIGKAVPARDSDLLGYDLSSMQGRIGVVQCPQGKMLVAYAQMHNGKLGSLYEMQEDNKVLKLYEERANDSDSRLVSQDLLAQAIAMMHKYSDTAGDNVEYVYGDYPPELILSEALHVDSYNFFDDQYNLVPEYISGRSVPDLLKRVQRIFVQYKHQSKAKCCTCALL